MMSRKQAKKVSKHFEKMVCRIEQSGTKEKDLLINIGKAKSFIKALELAEVIDKFTEEEMKCEILDAEQTARKSERKANA